MGHTPEVRDRIARAYITSSYQKIFGRAPTEIEIAEAYPSLGTDPNLLDRTNMEAFLAQLYRAEQNNPQAIAKRQMAEYQAGAPKFYDQISQMFQGTLGRDATDSEKQHFGSLMAEGTTDAYTIGQYLQALPESVRKQDEEFRKSLGTELQSQDTRYYQEQILPAIQQQMAQQGRQVSSSGFANAALQAAQGQNRQRESFLSNLTAAQYGGSQGLAQDAYKQAYGTYLANQDYAKQRAAQLQDQTTGRMNDIVNFNMQKQAYDDYLKRYGKRGTNWGAIGSMLGTAAGAGLGFMAGGPAGAYLGANVGGGLGGAAGYGFGGY